MSRSESPGAEPFLPLLRIHGPPGVEIQVLNGGYDTLARGTELLEERMPQGVYIVRWIGAEAVEEEVVRLMPYRRPLTVRPAGSERVDRKLAKMAAEAAPVVAAATGGRDAQVVVLARGDDPDRAREISRGLRLYTLGETAMRSDRAEVEGLQEDSDVAVGPSRALRVYPVDPGSYRLRFAGLFGEALEQIVPALPGRRTVVLLQQGVGQTIVAAKDGVSPRSFNGVDAQRTVLLSAPLRGRSLPTRDDQRLAEGLLAGLSGGSGVLSLASLKRIEQPDADPLLKLYAAVFILEALNAERTPALDDPWPRTSEEFVHRWTETARRLLEDLPEPLAADRKALLDESAETAPSPTLLAAVWRRLKVDPSDPPACLRGPVAGAVEAGPWLAWRAAAAKGGEVKAPAVLDAPPKDDTPVFAMSSLAVVGGLGGVAWVGASPLLSDLGKGLDHLRLGEVVERLDTDGLPKWIALLAGLWLLALVARLVWRRLARPRPTEVPALLRPVIHFDDSNKGRFGSQPSVDGFTLSASFEPTDNPALVWLTLTVTAERPRRLREGDIARFVLHDTFSPRCVDRRFHEGAAQLTVMTYGGFTAGVWLPRQKVELELDLAEIADAPRVIREA